MDLAHENRNVGPAVLASLLLVLASMALAADSANQSPPEHFFTLTFGDLLEELRIARDQKKIGMLLFFEADECPYCQYMNDNIFNQIRVLEWYRERFINIAVDIHGDIEIIDFKGITLPSKKFADQREIFLTPVISFIDLNGNEVYRHLGMIKTPAEFLLLGQFIEDKQYLNTTYKGFAESNGMPNSDNSLTTPTAAGDAT